MSATAKPGDGPVRRYDQYCSVARSLDVLGERWTLLIVRSLLMGSQRYTDLRDALPGIATDLLTARLRTLEQAGYVQRRELPRPARVTVYELTDSGQRLAPIVLELARLGLERLGPPAPDEQLNTETVVLSLRARFNRDAAGRPPRSYQLEIDGERFAVNVENASADTVRGNAEDPACTISTSSRTLAELLVGSTDAKTALAQGDVQLTGRPEELDRFLDTFAHRGAPGRQAGPAAELPAAEG